MLLTERPYGSKPGGSTVPKVDVSYYVKYIHLGNGMNLISSHTLGYIHLC